MRAMKRAAVLLAFAVGAFSVSAYDFTGSGFTPAPGAADPASGIKLTDESGGKLSLVMETEPDAARIQALRAIVAEVRSWKNMTVASIRASNSESRLAVVVGIKSFLVGGKELSGALLGGVQVFYEEGSTEYDFKVASGRYVMRVRGVYTGEDDMEAAASEAYTDPDAFALARDPAVLAKRIGALEVDRDRLRTVLLAALNGAKPINPAAVAKLRDLKASNPGLTKAEASKALKAAGVSLSSAEISAVYLVYFGDN